MPLSRADQTPIQDATGDIYFAMVDQHGATVPCEVAIDYLVALMPFDFPPDSLMGAFTQLRDEIEALASENYDAFGADSRGMVRLEPSIV